MSSNLPLISEKDASDLDQYIYPQKGGDETLLELWQMNGHYLSLRYTDPEINSFSAIIRARAKSHANALAYMHPAVDAADGFHKVTFQQLDQLVSKASVWYAQAFAQEIAVARDRAAQPTIALIGVGTTFDYFIAMLALLRLHIRVLLLSNKNSAVTHRYLLAKCGAVGCIVDELNTHVLHDKEEAFLQGPVRLAAVGELHKLDSVDASLDVATLGFKVDDPWELPSVIIHSSGTTGMPKPIVHTNRSLCLISRHYRLYRDMYFENYQLCAPLFHIGGLLVALSGIPVGKTGTFPPLHWPPPMSALLAGWDVAAAQGHAIDAAQMAPDLVEDLYIYISSTTNDFAPVSKLKVLQSGGAPFAPALLEKLFDLGINMKTVYGQTEIAGPLRTLPHGRENRSLARLRNLYQGAGWVGMEDLGTGDGVAECVVYKDYPMAAQLWEDADAPNPYRTNDIFREDPVGSGFWVLIGRKDDVVVHSIGEKTMAGGVATLLADSGPAILNAAVFGTNRPCTAAVIGVRWEAVGDADDAAVEALVWEAVQKCNELIPAHSRLDRSLLLILGRDRALPVTPKGSVRRKIAWDAFGPEIDALFDRFLSGQQGVSAADDTLLDGLSDADYVKACVAAVCEVEDAAILADKSFYDVGLDSQRAVKLRAMLTARFGPFPMMFIFENPTVDKLLAYLQGLGAKDGDDAAAPAQAGDEQKKHQWIKSTIDRYCREIDGWKTEHGLGAETNGTNGYTNGVADGGHVIYLTGSNGAVGNALIEYFVREPTVSKVYCAVRGTADTVQAKLIKSLVSRGYSTDISQSCKLIAVPYAMADAKLGLGDELFSQLKNEVTTVLHNAWKLDFNQPVSMFESDCLQGTMHLLSFCLAGRHKKTFAFTSSVSAVMGPAMAGKRVEELPVGDNVRSPSGTGYAQSKYIVERVTQHYSSALAMPVRLLRVGQLCGHSVLGVWNESEMWPIMIATGLDHMNAMPVLDSTRVNWLPVDACARAAGRIVTSKHSDLGDLYTVNNLVHPAPISWDTYLNLLAEASGKAFERMPIAAWTAALETLAEKGRTDVPGTKLLGYFQSMAASPESENSDFATASVVGLDSLDVAAVRNWFQRWNESGFVKFSSK